MSASICSLYFDVVRSAKRLASSPCFTFVAIITLSLGISANAAIFSVVDAVVLKPQPIFQANRVVHLGWYSNADPRWKQPVSFLECSDIVQRTDLFSGVVAYQPFRQAMTIGGQAHLIIGEFVSGNYFQVLRLSPLRGRLFDDSDMRVPGVGEVAVISESLWRRYFGGDDAVIGTDIVVSGEHLTIVGVVQEGFRGLYQPSFLQNDIWIPITKVQDVLRRSSGQTTRQLNASPAEDKTTDATTDVTALDTYFTDRSFNGPLLTARLRDGVSFDQAEAAAPEIDAELKSARTKSVDIHFYIHLGGSQGDEQVGAVALPFSVALLGLLGIVLLVTCANVANMVLARQTGRVREIAARIAMGATRTRVVKEFMIEHVVLALIAGAVAVPAASVFINLLKLLSPPEVAGIIASVKPVVDWRVVMYALGAAIVTALAFGLVPSLRSSRIDVIRALQGDMITVDGSRSPFSIRNLIASGQIAACLVLLSLAAVLLMGFFTLNRVDTGISRENVAIASVELDLHGYDRARADRFARDLLSAARRSGEVQAAALTTRIPSGILGVSQIYLEGDSQTMNQPMFASVAKVSPGLFSILGIRLIDGRDFRDDDAGAAPRVAIISEGAAHRFWPGLSPLGRRLAMTKGEDWAEVVGVVANTRAHLFRSEQTAFVYTALSQSIDSRLTLVARTRQSSRNAVQALGRVITALAPEVVVIDAKTIDEYFSGFLYPYRSGAILLGILGVTALALAVVGIYGVVAYLATQRTREIGIRIALGATTTEIRTLFLLAGLRVILFGVLVGTLLSLFAGVLVSSMIFGLVQHTVPILAAVSISLAAIALLACYLPARKAARLDAMVILRAS